MKPILFNTQMVKAILEGRKTVTRRVMKPQPDGPMYRKSPFDLPGFFVTQGGSVYIAPYQSGDILYVRESWQFFPCFDCVKSMCDTTPLTYEDSDSVTEGCWIYKADYIESDQKRVCWHPSIHMPKQAARIFLRVKDVLPEPLKNIRYFDCLAEGIPYRQMEDAIIRDFAELWDSTIKPADRGQYRWDANPWVWVNKFERISRKEALEESQ